MQKELNTKPAETKIIHLEWADLAHRKDISTIADDIAGIYIWGFYKPPDFLPYYVGKATGNGTYSDIKHRLWTHLCRLMGGEYCILKKDNLRDFHKYKGKEWEQLAYVPGKHDIEDFINQRYDKPSGSYDARCPQALPLNVPSRTAEPALRLGQAPAKPLEVLSKSEPSRLKREHPTSIRP